MTACACGIKCYFDSRMKAQTLTLIKNIYKNHQFYYHMKIGQATSFLQKHQLHIIKPLYNLIMNIDIENIGKQINMKVQRVLGKGSFATVYFCIDKNTSVPYAVKIFHKQDFTKHRLKSFRKQAEILASIEHKNIVKFNSFKQTESSLYLIMQYIAGGTLKQLMNGRFERNQKFNDSEVSIIMKSILEGIQYLHKFNIIHRDLKPENILVADPGDIGSIKIVDFGLSAQIEAGSPKNVKSQCGTLLYMAPQILHQPSYSKAVDIWSCAIIMYILYTGKHPIYVQGMRSQQFKQKLKSCNFPKLENPLADNFIRNLSKIQYTERYSVNEALRHPWITRNDEDEIPLSVTDSIQGFNTSHLVIDTLKFVLTVGQIMKATSYIVPDQYKIKVSKFNQKHDQCRLRSPSQKKNRKKKTTNDNLVKLKQLIINKEKDNEMGAIESSYSDIESPLLAKHQKLFLRLFEKHKIEERGQTLVLEQCEQQIIKLEQESLISVENGQTISMTAQITSPILISCNSFTSTRNNAIINYDMEIPLLKINQDKKQRGGIRKLNSLREEVPKAVKQQQNLSYFKNWNTKASEQKNRQRQALISSKSKRSSYKYDNLNFQFSNNIKNGSKKPQTAERGKANSKNKQLVRPMVFGFRGSQT